SPFRDGAVVKGKDRRIFVKKCPLVEIGTDTLSPIDEGKDITVSPAMAVYLVGWGAAELR
ncbi:MAG: hypothetical protein U1C71_03800, partial [archaeon]|nr:hypothetical protein [archaeon]